MMDERPSDEGNDVGAMTRQDRGESRIEIHDNQIRVYIITEDRDVRKYTYKFEKESLSSRTGIVLG